MSIFTRSIWVQVQQHNWKYTLRTRPIRGILWHATRGNQGYNGTVETSACVNWFVSPNNKQFYASGPAAGISNFIIGPGQIIEAIPVTHEPKYSSWPADTVGLSVEVAQSNLGQAIEPSTIQKCVEFAYWASGEFNFPLTRTFRINDDTLWTGMVGHAETVQGRNQGKSDPDNEFWTPFMAALNKEDDMTPQQLEEHNALVAIMGGRAKILAAAAGGMDFILGYTLEQAEQNQIDDRLKVLEAQGGVALPPGTEFTFKGRIV